MATLRDKIKRPRSALKTSKCPVNLQAPAQQTARMSWATCGNPRPPCASAPASYPLSSLIARRL